MCQALEKIDNKILNYKSKYLIFFLPQLGLDRNKLQLTTIGEYSITHHEVSSEISKIIRDQMKGKGDLVITDATAGMGGDTIVFAHDFEKVNAVEMNELHCKVLKNNIGVYGLTNVNVICGDYTKMMDEIEQDLLYIDAPFGGRSYKEVDKLQLCLGSMNVADITNKVKAKLVALKVPHNFDFDDFKKKVKGKMKVYKFQRFDLIVVKKGKNGVARVKIRYED
jgi:16S rRNA G966 N2-methylase RsmD